MLKYVHDTLQSKVKLQNSMIFVKNKADKTLGIYGTWEWVYTDMHSYLLRKSLRSVDAIPNCFSSGKEKKLTLGEINTF